MERGGWQGITVYTSGWVKKYKSKGTPSLSRRMPMEFHLLNSMQVYGALNNVQKKYFSKSFIWPGFFGVEDLTILGQKIFFSQNAFYTISTS